MYEQKHDYVAIKAKYKRWRDGQFGNDVEFMKQENLAHGTFKKILSDWKEDFAKDANDAQAKTLEGVDWRRESRELDEQRQAEKEKQKEDAETDIASGDIGKLAKKKVIELMNGDKEQTALRAAIEVLDMEGQRKKGGGASMYAFMKREAIEERLKLLLGNGIIAEHVKQLEEQ